MVRRTNYIAPRILYKLQFFRRMGRVTSFEPLALGLELDSLRRTGMLMDRVICAELLAASDASQND